MSYTILYKSMFVKMSDGRCIPMVEMGDNNYYEASYNGKSRRVRDWNNISLNGAQKFFTEQEITDIMDNWLDDYTKKRDSDTDGNFEFGFYDGIAIYGKHCYNTTFNDVNRIIKNGIKNAISFDDAVKHCNLHITYHIKDGWQHKSFDNETDMYAFIADNLQNGNYWFAFGKCVDSYYSTIKAIKAFTKKGNVKQFYLQTLDFNKEKKQYVRIENDTFVLTNNIADASYFTKYKANGIGLTNLIYKLFDDVCSIHFLYKNA